METEERVQSQARELLAGGNAPAQFDCKEAGYPVHDLVRK